MKDRKNCIVSDVEKMRLSFALSPVPSSNVMNREIVADNDPEITANIATTPPTTL